MHEAEQTLYLKEYQESIEMIERSLGMDEQSFGNCAAQSEWKETKNCSEIINVCYGNNVIVFFLSLT